MNIPDSDPLVFFGAIGDLAHKPLLNCISPTFQLRI
jgi:glucose-6-phosphate 1-dehydrogenase